jgi:hypothetical protein
MAVQVAGVRVDSATQIATDRLVKWERAVWDAAPRILNPPDAGLKVAAHHAERLFREAMAELKIACDTLSTPYN